jgi:hypothetical protein
VGTSRGYITVWDLRFQQVVKCWRHSSLCAVNSLELCPPLSMWLVNGQQLWEPPLVYAAVGNNEVRQRTQIECRYSVLLFTHAALDRYPPGTSLAARSGSSSVRYHRRYQRRRHSRCPTSRLSPFLRMVGSRATTAASDRPIGLALRRVPGRGRERLGVRTVRLLRRRKALRKVMTG